MEIEEQVPQIDDHSIIPSPPIPSKDRHRRRRRRFVTLPLTVRKGHDRLIFSPLKALFGPYHAEGVQEKQSQERWYSRCCEGIDKPMQCFVDALAPIIDDLWNAYDTPSNSIPYRYTRYRDTYRDRVTSDFRSVLMIVDGSFILDIMLEDCHGCGHININEIDTYRRDMLLLVNQIPLKVLEVVASILDPQSQPEELVKCLILEFFSLPKVSVSKWSENLHMLDIYRAGLLQEELLFVNGDAHVVDIKPSKHLRFYIPSAIELHDASIEIKASSTRSLITGISFSHATLRLPEIDIDDMAKSIFHNVIWLERLDPHVRKQFCSYVCFMNRLLKRAEDSSLLQSRGIINTTLCNDEVVDLFNSLRKHIGSSPGMIMEARLLDVGQALRERYNRNTEVWRKDLVQNYLRSPWAVISVFAALLILSLSVVQTVYTILSYYDHH